MITHRNTAAPALRAIAYSSFGACIALAGTVGYPFLAGAAVSLVVALFTEVF